MNNKVILGNNIKKYMNKYSLNRNKVCKDLNISYPTLVSWIKGINYPRMDKVDMLARYFHISKTNLLENSTDTPTIKKIINILPDLKENNLKTILRYINNVNDLNDSAINSYFDLSHEAKTLILGFMVTALKDSKKK